MFLSKQIYSIGYIVDYYKDDDYCLCGLFRADNEAKKNYQRYGDNVSIKATFRFNN